MPKFLCRSSPVQKFLCRSSPVSKFGYPIRTGTTVLVVHGDLRSLIMDQNDQFRYFIYYKTEIQSIQTRKTKLRSTKLPILPWQIKFKYWFKLGNSSLDKFNFRWLKNSAIEIGKAASIALISSHLNWKPSYFNLLNTLVRPPVFKTSELETLIFIFFSTNLYTAEIRRVTTAG